MKKYPGKEVRQWYLEKLTGIEVQGKAIPCFNLARIESKPPFILLVNQTSNDANTKGTYADNVSILVQCITEFTGDFGGDVFADEIANAVISKIMENRPDYGQTANFRIVTCNISSNETLRRQTESDTYITRQINFEHFVEQI